MAAIGIVIAGMLLCAAAVGAFIAWVALSIRASARRHNAFARRRRAEKPGPSKRAEQRLAIFAKAAEMQRDTAAGIVCPLAPVNYNRKARA